MPSEYTILDGINPVGQAKLIVKGFGLGLIKPKFYNVKPISDDEFGAVVDGDLNSGVGLWGLPVFDVLEFDSLDYTDLDGKKYHLEGLSFGTALLVVTMSKNIVTTPIQGRNGTVKEYISDGDFMINIKGMLVGNGVDVSPTKLKSDLVAYCKAPVEFGVASNLLTDFGIKSIVIKDYSFPQIEGSRNTVPFELSCLSDSPIELKSQKLS
jgi:hypothetical protein